MMKMIQMKLMKVGLVLMMGCCFQFAVANNDEGTVERTKNVAKDTTITGLVKANLAQEDFYDRTNFSVTTEHGVVVLTGCVRSQQDVEIAKHRVENIAGVKGVIDKVVQKNDC